MKKYTLLLVFMLILTTSCQAASEPTLVPTSEPTLVPTPEPTLVPTPEPNPAVPFSVLEPYWSDWAQRDVSGPYEVYCERSGDNVLSGVNIQEGQTMSFDGTGNLVPPTSDGSLITFRTDDCTFMWINGIGVQATSHLTFVVSDGMGLVYKEGSGTVVLPNGDTLVYEP